jgi:hypothetical protein
MKNPKSYIFFQDSTLVMREVQRNGEASEEVKLFIAGMCVAIRNILQIKNVFFITLYCDHYDTTKLNLSYSYSFGAIEVFLYKKDVSEYYKDLAAYLISVFEKHSEPTDEQKLQLNNLYNSNY